MSDFLSDRDSFQSGWVVLRVSAINYECWWVCVCGKWLVGFLVIFVDIVWTVQETIVHWVLATLSFSLWLRMVRKWTVETQVVKFIIRCILLKIVPETLSPDRILLFCWLKWIYNLHYIKTYLIPFASILLFFLEVASFAWGIVGVPNITEIMDLFLVRLIIDRCLLQWFFLRLKFFVRL